MRRQDRLRLAQLQEAEGVTTAELAKLFGVSTRTVGRWCDSLGLPHGWNGRRRMLDSVAAIDWVNRHPLLLRACKRMQEGNSK